MTTAELAAHNPPASSTQSTHTHTATDAGHTHGLTQIVGGTGWAPPGGAGINNVNANTQTGFASITVAAASAGAITTTTANTGSGTAHNTMQPFIVLNKIIKT